MRTINASQIKAYRACKRKWAWGYLVFPRNAFETGPQALGTDTHKQAENYLKYGLGIDFTRPSGDIISAGMHYWPKPHIPRVVESTLTDLENGLHGTLDLLTIEPDGTLCVWDHKTTKSFAYALTPETLVQDPQGVLYPWLACRSTQIFEPVKLRWIYYRTTGAPKSHLVEATIDFRTPEAQYQLIQLKRTADEIRTIPRDINPLTLPPNPAECSAYGGCAFIGHCALSEQEKLFAVMTQAHFEETARGHLVQAQAEQQKVEAIMSNAAPSQAQFPACPPGYQWVQTPQGWTQQPIQAQPQPAAPQMPAGFPMPPPGAVNPPPQPQPTALPTPPQGAFGLPPQTMNGAPPPGPAFATPPQMQQPQFPPGTLGATPPPPPGPEAPTGAKRGRKPKPNAGTREAYVAAAAAFAGAHYDLIQSIADDSE